MVNPTTAERDLNVPRALKRGFGHVNMGIYAEVTAGGEVAAGDSVDAASAPLGTPG
jgi:MOSC domain-containing protein YiiM